MKMNNVLSSLRSSKEFVPFRLMITLVLMLFITAATVKQSYAQELRVIMKSAIEHYNAGDCESALPLFSDILGANLKQITDNSTLEYTLNYYAGYCARDVGEHDKTVRYFTRASVLAEKLEIVDQIPVINSFLGDAAREQGDYRRAVTYYNRAVLSLPKDSLEAATVWYFLSDVYRQEKRYDYSISSCERATEISEKAGNMRIQLSCLSNMGEVYLERGDYPNAIQNFNQAVSMARLSQLPVDMADNHAKLAAVYSEVYKLTFARQNYVEAAKLYIASDALDKLSPVIRSLTDMPPDKEQAHKYLESYAQLNEMIERRQKNQQLLIDMQILLANSNVQVYKMIEGLIHYSKAYDLAVINNFYEKSATIAIIVSNIKYDLGDFEGAFGTLAAAQEHHMTKESSTQLAKLYAQQASLNIKMGRKILAKANYRQAIKSATTDDEVNMYTQELNSL